MKFRESLTDKVPKCWTEDRIIAIQEGKPCKLPEESKYDSLCVFFSKARPIVSDLSIKLSQNLGLLTRNVSIHACLSCNTKERIIYLQSQGVVSPIGIFTFEINNSDRFIIVIYPKIFKDKPHDGLGALIYMIERVLASQTNSGQEAYITRLLAGDGSLLDIWMRMIYILYIKLLKRELLKGGYHEYIRVVLDSSRVSGKILVSRQARKPILGKLSIIQESYPYTVDNTLNRVLKYATTIIYNTFIKSGRIAGEAREVLSLLSDVELDPSSVWRRVEFNRLNMRFENLYHIALIIILTRGFPGDNMLNGLLIDMNKLFELYIYSLLKEWLKNWQIEYQVRLEFASIYKKTHEWKPISIGQYPDILIRSRLNDQCIILDTKYSQISSLKEIKIEDLRQIFTYHTLLENLGKRECAKGNVYSAILYLAGNIEKGVYIKNIYGTYKSSTHQNCFKVILLSPYAILKAAKNITIHTDIEKKITEGIVDFVECRNL